MHTVYCENKRCIYEYKGGCYLLDREIHLDPEGICLDFESNESEDEEDEI